MAGHCLFDSLRTLFIEYVLVVLYILFRICQALLLMTPVKEKSYWDELDVLGLKFLGKGDDIPCSMVNCLVVDEMIIRSVAKLDAIKGSWR